MPRIIAALFLFYCCIPAAIAQRNFTLSGTVSDKGNGEGLIGATVIVDNLLGTGTSTNSYGFYSITLPEGEYSVRFQYIGYESKTIRITLSENLRQNIGLGEQAYTLENITITSEKPDRNITSAEMGNVRLDPKQVAVIPVLFGERDVLKTFQLMPGVKSAGEGNSGYHVRGGSVGQNLILLDEAPVYNSSHLLGFFSIFNSDAIKDATLLKGSIPAEYGGRSSSVMDIIMKDGNLKKFGMAGNLGLISSSLAAEGPFVKDKGSYIVSGRRTYADMFLLLSGDKEMRSTSLYFYDLNAKANWIFNENNRLYLSGYFGRDNFGFRNEFGFDWGSATGTLRWNHIFNSRLFSNTSFIASNYSYKIDIHDETEASIRSVINDWNLKQDFTFYLNAANTVKFGGNIIFHTILPGKITSDNILESRKITSRRAVETVLYVSNSHEISEKLKLYYGVRLALFTNVGPGDFYEFDSDGNLTKTNSYDKFKFIKTQGGPEPRLALAYRLGKSGSVKVSYNRIYQFLHLLSNSTTTLPTDLWLPSSDNVKPEISQQVAVGYFRNFKNNGIETSLEVYYKKQQNEIDYKNGADLVFNSTVEAELVFGEGWSYGAELLVKKNFGRLTGWAGYTWSKTERLFETINSGNPFPARHDRTHDISLVGVYSLTDKLKLSGSWVYYTGNAVTFPSGKYEIEGQSVGYYTERNGYRMPPYHRLDLGLEWISRKTGKFEASWIFSVYNAYARENAYYIDFRESETAPGQIEAVQVSLFKMIPSVSYRFKF